MDGEEEEAEDEEEEEVEELSEMAGGEYEELLCIAVQWSL